MILLTDVYHRIIKEKPTIDVAVDMTCGHGNDTLFLAKHAKRVYGFDIQTSAINETAHLVNDYLNVQLIHDDHQKIDQYVKASIDVAIFNLGYLPGGDHSIITEASSTLAALRKVINQLSIDGLIVIELYPHNPKEIETIHEYTSKLSSNYEVVKIDLINKTDAPWLIIIKKNR